MLTRTTLAASLAVAAALFAAPATGLASDADFVLKNRTGYQIDEVYVSSHSSRNWGKDIMGRGTLDDGDDVTITFPHGGGQCRFDVKVKYHDDDSTAEWGDVNLCDYQAISLFWDAKQQATRAVGE